MVGRRLVNGFPVAQVRHGTQIAEAEGLVLECALVQRPCEVRSLLTGDLRCLRKVGLAVYHGAVTDDEDVVEALGCKVRTRAAGFNQSRAEPIIGDDATRLGVFVQLVLGGGCSPTTLCLSGEHTAQAFAHELLNQGVLHQPRGPHHHTCTNLFVVIVLDFQTETSGAVGIRPDPLDTVPRLDVDMLTLEQAHGVIGEGLVKHGQDLGRNVVHSDLHVGHQRRVDAREVVVDEVVQLGGELDARGPAADDGKVQQAPPRLVVDRGAGALLKEREDAQADPPRVANVAQKVRVLPDAVDAEGLAVGAHGDDEFVVGHVCHWALDCCCCCCCRCCCCWGIMTVGGGAPIFGRREDGLARQVVGGSVLLDTEDLAGKVDVVGPALVELDAAAVVLAQAPDRLEGRPELEGADGGRGEQGREDEVGAGRDDDALVLCGIQGAGKSVACPACGKGFPGLKKIWIYRVKSIFWLWGLDIPDPRMTTRSFFSGWKL